MKKVSVIIAAAGKSERFVSPFGVKKQFFNLSNKPVVVWTVEKFISIGQVSEIVVLLPSEEIPFWEGKIKRISPKIKRVVAGGATRVDSVLNGLLYVSEEYVLIHDGVRPCVSKELILKIIDELDKYNSVIPVIPASETLKLVDEVGFVEKTIPREKVYAVQTPQGFRTDLIKRAYLRIKQKQKVYKDLHITDDAQVAEEIFGKKCRIRAILGDVENIKITTFDDLKLVRLILSREK